MENNIGDRQNGVIESFQSLFGKEELLAKVIDFFPYPIQVYKPDGTSVLVNKAMLAEYHVSDPGLVVGKYNVFKDPYIVASGHLQALERAFQGETVYFQDIKVPLEEIAERYGLEDFDVEAVYQDITVFPILDDRNRVTHVVALLINRRVYRGKSEIEKAKEYIENHWLEKYDATETARTVCLSKAHFNRLFKKHTGSTPYEYYVNYKVSKLKEMLRETDQSIAGVFAACNMDYNGHSVKLFKKRAGVSPSAYRKMCRGQ